MYITMHRYVVAYDLLLSKGRSDGADLLDGLIQKYLSSLCSNMFRHPFNMYVCKKNEKESLRLKLRPINYVVNFWENFYDLHDRGMYLLRFGKMGHY